MANSRRDRMLRTMQGRVARLEQGRRIGLFVAVTRRFVEIDGLTFGALLSIELLTTVLPLLLLSFGYFSNFAGNASLGDVVVRHSRSRAAPGEPCARPSALSFAAIVVDNHRDGRMADLGHSDGHHGGVTAHGLETQRPRPPVSAAR